MSELWTKLLEDLQASLGLSAVTPLKFKWTHLSSMLRINHRHHRIITYLHYSLPSEPRRRALCSAWVKRLKMQFVSWMMNALAFWERKLSATEVALFFVLGFFCGVADSFEVSSLTNCIFKFWSNTTLRSAVSLYSNSLNYGWMHRKVLTRIWHHMTSRYKDWNKSILAFLFLLLICFLLGISLSEICFWKPLWCQITSRIVCVVVCVISKAWTVIWVVCLMSVEIRNKGNKQTIVY